MTNKTWQTLKALVESPDFEEPKDFDKTLNGILKTVLGGKINEIWTSNRDLLTYDWIKGVCADYGFKPSGNNRLNLLKNAFPQIYVRGVQDDFYARIETLRRERERVIKKEKQAVELYQKAFSSQDKAKVFTEAWLKAVCKKMGIAIGITRRQLFLDALKQIYIDGMEEQFLAAMDEKQKTTSSVEPLVDTEELTAIYKDICGNDLETTEKKLMAYFPPDANFERVFKLFIRQFGIQEARVRKRTTWLRKVAEELAKFHGGGRFLD